MKYILSQEISTKCGERKEGLKEEKPHLNNIKGKTCISCLQ